MKLKRFDYIDVIIDNPQSWMWNYIDKLESILVKYSQHVRIFKNSNEIKNGDILFILSCDKILREDNLKKHTNNIVIHESNLPQGKGWSPLSYQVEVGENAIPITLFEADIKLDSGKWYLKDIIKLDGFELIDVIREKQVIKSFELIEQYLINYPINGNPQIGKETFYEKRDSQKQQLDIKKSIEDQFNQLRVCDNENYPAFFYMNGKKYILKIEAAK
jgi:methionyl-tRNA formyltransferase